LAAELKMTQDILNSVESEVKLKDSIILRLYEKDVTNVEILRLEREKYDIVNGYSKKVEQELKKEKSKNKLVNIIYSSIIGVLTILLITK
jgi:translation initiation factor IF-2